MKKKIYLSAGWFNDEQANQQQRMFDFLKDEFDVFNPKIEGVIDSNSTLNKMDQILLGNIRGMKECDAIVMIYDFKDTGAIWEAGWCHAIGKPIFYFAEYLNGKPFNLMLARTGHFASSMPELIDQLRNNENYVVKDIYHDYRGTIE